MANDAQQEWKLWREERLATVSAPFGPLSVSGTLWLDDAEEGKLPGLPGHWSLAGKGVALRADAADGLSFDGEALDGAVTLGADRGEPSDSRLAYGRQRLIVLRREALWAVRVFDPESAARRAFEGIDAFAYDPRWALPAVFRPYEEGRTIKVPNADGTARGLRLGGELAFTVEGSEHTLAAGVEAGGGLFIVFADATSGRTSYRFRFQRTAAPSAMGSPLLERSRELGEGSLTVDFNRATLPPCAFTDHFLCPFPPPGNTLDLAIDAGERDITSV